MSTWIQFDRPALVLAPMEGVTDAPMRAFLTERPAFHFCVSEFLRISQQVPPSRVFFKHVPELKEGAKTPGGVRVQVQLLGGNPERMALSAERACALGAQAIDINFGCPAPLVNRHDGGAALLKFPCRIEEIVHSVRKAVPKGIPVSAKLRLGWEESRDIFKNAERAEAGGASWITVHARTKIQGYAPPVDWKLVGEVRKAIGIPLVANGDIWSYEDFLRCQEETECVHFMLGRGAVANPNLAPQIAQSLGIHPVHGKHNNFGSAASVWKTAISRFANLNTAYVDSELATAKRIKQWVKMAGIRETIPWFDRIKILETPAQILLELENICRAS